MKTDHMPQTKAVPSRDELISIIEGSGSGSEAFFGYPEKEDGLYLQQDSEEFAHFIHFAATRLEPAKLAVDIGIASGGQTKFLRDYYPVEKTIVVDIGQHPDFKHWERIKKSVNSEIVLELIEDSHSSKVRETLQPYFGQVDFAYVDGDHSYRGLRKDIYLARDLLKTGGIMVLHDTLGVPDCRKVYLELLKSRNFRLLRDLPFRFGISIWQLGRKRDSNAINQSLGWGKL